MIAVTLFVDASIHAGLRGIFFWRENFELCTGGSYSKSNSYLKRFSRVEQLKLAWCVVCPVEEVGFVFEDDAPG